MDHDCEIGKHVNIAPGVTLCGNKIDEILLALNVIQNINIGKKFKIGGAFYSKILRFYISPKETLV